MDQFFEQEILFRLLPFLGIFALLTVWEIFAPKRMLTVKKPYRWANNLGVFAINTVLSRLVFPASAVGVALAIEPLGLGLFQLAFLSQWPYSIKCIVSFLLLDFTIWLQHVLFHAVPVLWRLHRMHHADLDIDLTTGVRFHPLEILLSITLKACVIIMLGAPVAAVLVFEIALNATAMFNHSNINLPKRLDRWLRLMLVTPDMHRVHHSWHIEETNSNYGFNLPWWDRLLGTYCAQPKDGHQAMTIGLHAFRTPHASRIDKLLVQPFTPANRP